jgi:glycosyltransferase involved in cell wall biosynthesis
MSEGVRTEKVVHVIGALIAGGAETFVVSLLTLLSRHIDVELLVLSPRVDDKTDWLRARLAEANVTVRIGPTEGVGLGTVLWYRRRLLASAATAVHLHTPNTELVHACAEFSWSTRFDLFRTVHSAHPEQRALMKLALRLNRACCSIAVGDAVREVLVRGPYQAPFRTIRNGVLFGSIPKPDDRQKARLRLGLAADARIYLSVGRMSASTFAGLAKAQDVLLDAWRMFVTENDADESEQTELHLLGDGNLRTQLEANQPPRVFFQGVQPDVTDWLLACDWFVMPSRFEGLPIAGIEAIGYGAHCIFSGIAPLRELSPRTAIWVEPGSASSLLQGLQSSRQVAPTPVDRDWLNDFRGRYGLEQTAASYLQLYQHALSKSEPSLTALSPSVIDRS